MSQQQISLKTVYDLRVNASDVPIRYRIPAYQRGYRWTPTQVTQLLEDIRDFTQRENPKPEEFYCLQPLVLRVNDDDAYEVVDGQQRLTTLLLIMRHFNERLAKKYQQKLYLLEYETRPNLAKFLENPDSEKAAANIDYFHIAQAVKTIEEWFVTRDSEVEAIKDAFLNKTKVIWFQLSSAEKPVAAFTRLNVGKIPLTNAELIRAIFLKRRNGDTASAIQLRIAYEWDLLEKTLQDNQFWCFLSNDTEKPGARIDFLFDLVAKKQGMQKTSDDYATFIHFSQQLAGKDAEPENVWQAVKRTFMLLEEWFQDRTLYHLVGYLIWDSMGVNDILTLATDCTKQEFKKLLKKTICDRALGPNSPADVDKLSDWIAERLDNLEYPRDSRRIRSVLLLFNLATLLESDESNMRFQFENFKVENWDIEHVRSVSPDQPGTYKGQVEWLTNCLNYLQQAEEAPELQKDISDFLKLTSKLVADLEFEPIYNRVLGHFKEANGDEPNHGIDNLVLLDYATNRSYKNSVFAVKRHRILSLDRHGIFVPLCTRNVFLKCYNPRVDHVMFWTKEDTDGYWDVIIDTLHRFIAEGTANE